MASPARSRWILAAILLISIAVAWRFRSHRAPQYPVAYIGDNAAILWNTTAQVRQSVATLGYGERVAVLRRAGDMAEVRSDDGARGWMDARPLMDSELWRKVGALLSRAQTLPVEASGHLKAVSNLHTEPGRDAPRLLRLARGTPVVVLDRRVKAVPAVRPTGEDEVSESAGDQKPKEEDWLFVLRRGAERAKEAAPGASPTGTSGSKNAEAAFPVAGWTLGRFVELDPPEAIRDYASSSGMRVVSWAVLDKVPDGDQMKPQYVVAGARGPEGQPCDFTLLRVYTWGIARQRYETAYVESNLCGRLPILVERTASGVEFHFMDLDEAKQQRIYRLKQTIVRRVQQQQPPAARPGKRR